MAAGPARKDFAGFTRKFSSALPKVNVGIVGLGTVGMGTVETLLKQKTLMQDRIGVDLVVKKAADLDLDRDFGFEVPADLVLTKDAMEIINDPDINIVVELIGGKTFAKTLIEGALKNGKSVVTANKALLADHPELFQLAIANNADLFYEAAVAGGIPIIKVMREGLVANPIKSSLAIMNGTCNYILTRMEREPVTYEEVLVEAQKLGYAETPPDLDVDGWDTAHKTALLANIALGGEYMVDQMTVKGIRGISKEDVTYAAELGYRIKLLSIIKKTDDGMAEICVEPTLIPSEHLLSKVDMSFNAIFVEGEVVDETMYYGRGAGRLPTASAVVGDIADVARNCVPGSYRKDFNPQRTQHQKVKMKPYGEHKARAYVRVAAKDTAGTLAKVLTIMANQGIAVLGCKQERKVLYEKEHIILLTASAPIADLDAAVQEISDLPLVYSDEVVRYRVEAIGHFPWQDSATAP
jgi:homoserine dehydrogenase